MVVNKMFENISVKNLKITKIKIFVMFITTILLLCSTFGEAQNDSVIVKPNVYSKLDKNYLVRVIIKLRDEDSQIFSKVKNTNIKINEEKFVEETKRIQSKFLNSISTSDVLNIKKLPYRPIIGGYVTRQSLEKLKNNPNIERISIDRETSNSLDLSAEIISVNPNVWNTGLTGNGQAICVVDSGVDYTHSSLGGCSITNNINDGSCKKVIGGFDYVGNDNNPYDENGHGTHVAGIVTSTDTTYRGIAPDSRIVAVRITGKNGKGSEIDMVAGIDWCFVHKQEYNISIITMSVDLDDDASSGTCSGDAEDAINDAYNAGLLVLVASGNNGSKTWISSPACAQGATSVGATTKGDSMADYTNRYKNLDLLAPGGSQFGTSNCPAFSYICSADLGTGFIGRTGTSMATPHVAGAAALITQYQKSLGNSPSPNRIKESLVLSGKLVYDSESDLSFPRIDVLKALDYSYDYHTPGVQETIRLNSSTTKWIKQLNISSTIGSYKAKLDVPAGTDYDMALWRYDEKGNKIVVDESKNSGSSSEYISVSLMPSGIYFIEVSRVSGSGTATLSDPKYIIVNSNSNIPLPIGPVDGSETTSQPILRWTNTGASLYEIQIDDNPDFSSPVNLGSGTSVNVSKNYYIVPANKLSNQAYYWRVRSQGGNWSTDIDGDGILNDMDNDTPISIGILNDSNGIVSNYNDLMTPVVYQALHSYNGLSRESARKISKPQNGASYNYPALTVQFDKINSTVDFSDDYTSIGFQYYADAYVDSSSVSSGTGLVVGGPGAPPSNPLVEIGDCRNIVPYVVGPYYSVECLYGGRESDMMVAANLEPGSNINGYQTEGVYYFQIPSINNGYWQWNSFTTPGSDFYLRMNNPYGTKGIWGVGNSSNRAEMIIYPYFGSTSDPKPRRNTMYISKIRVDDGQSTSNPYDDKIYILNIGIPSSFVVTSTNSPSFASISSSSKQVEDGQNITFTLTSTKNDLTNSLAVIGSKSLVTYTDGQLINNNDSSYSLTWQVNSTIANNDEDLLIIAYNNQSNSSFNLDKNSGAKSNSTIKEILSSLTLSAKNYPKIDLLTPKAGQVWSKNKTIRWKASDPNNNNLNFTLQYSTDNGVGWTVLDSGLVGDYYTWNTALINDSTYIIRVIAFDSSSFQGSVFSHGKYLTCERSFNYW